MLLNRFLLNSGNFSHSSFPPDSPGLYSREVNEAAWRLLLEEMYYLQVEEIVQAMLQPSFPRIDVQILVNQLIACSLTNWFVRPLRASTMRGESKTLLPSTGLATLAQGIIGKYHSPLPLPSRLTAYRRSMRHFAFFLESL